MTTTRRVAAVMVHYGDHRRTIRAVLSHWDLKVFSRIIVVANDLWNGQLSSLMISVPG